MTDFCDCSFHANAAPTHSVDQIAIKRIHTFSAAAARILTPHSLNEIQTVAFFALADKVIILSPSRGCLMEKVAGRRAGADLSGACFC